MSKIQTKGYHGGGSDGSSQTQDDGILCPGPTFITLREYEKSHDAEDGLIEGVHEPWCSEPTQYEFVGCCEEFSGPDCCRTDQGLDTGVTKSGVTQANDG